MTGTGAQITTLGMSTAAAAQSLTTPIVLLASELAAYAADLAAERELSDTIRACVNADEGEHAASLRPAYDAVCERLCNAQREVETHLRAGRSVWTVGGVADPVGRDEIMVTRDVGPRVRMSLGLASAWLLDP